MRNDDFTVSDHIMDCFFRERGYSTDKPAPLRAVTVENSNQFQQAPKRRGRKPRVRTGGNVVAFARPAPQRCAPTQDRARARMDGVTKFIGALRKEALEKPWPNHHNTPPRNELPPAPDDYELQRRANLIAMGASITAHHNNRRTTGEYVSWQCFIAAAWARLGYAPPPMTAELRAQQLALPEPRT